MNKVILCGRLTKDVDIRTTNNGKSVATFTLAVKRNYKNENGEYDSDFINIVTYGSTADICAKYLKKGSQTITVGRMQNRDYEAKDGTKRYVTEVIAEEVEFVGQPAGSNKSNDLKTKLEQANISTPELTEIEDDDRLPF